MVWTDGSVRKVKGETVAGAGWVDEKGVTGLRRVGGIPTIMRAEMAAATMAVKTTAKDEQLTVFTDSLALLWLIRRWTREDFGFWIDREQHSDILQELLDLLRGRTAETHFVWVKAHAGNIGNEAADRQAHYGCVDEEEEPLWDREERNIKFRMPPTKGCAGEVLSWNGWSRAVTKRSIAFLGEVTKARLAATSDAISTQSLVKEGRGRRFLGAALASKDVDSRAKRDLLQARSFAFPTAAVVARYNKKESPDCKYCKKGIPETFGHLQCECTHFDGARRAAHNIIANVLVDEIARAHEGAVCFTDTAMGKMYSGCSDNIRLQKPDGLIIDRRNKRVLVVEFTRGIRDEPEEWRDKFAEKQTKYHLIRLFLQRRHRGYTVVQGTFVMGVLGTVDEGEWEEQLEAMAVEEEEHERIMRKCVRAGVLALFHVTSARRAATEELGLRTGKEGFDRSKRPRAA
jgi:ribonuclease HI